MKQLQKAVVLICLGILPLLLIITRLTSHNCAEVPTTSDFYFGGSTASKPARSGPGPPNTRPKLQPIDVVYTWVNGSDPNFKRSLKKQGGKWDAQRYFDWGTLKYSLRSVEKHAPWVRRVYLVTNGQVPHWLNTSSDLIRLVNHSQIFKNASRDLPTFNSNAIEHNMYRIEGLSDKFLYFNDDVFLGSPVSVQDFVYGWNGQWVYTDFLVDHCAPSCKIDWLANRQCDMPCNNSRCDFDGGDCSIASPDGTVTLTSSSPKLTSGSTTKKPDSWMSSLANANGYFNHLYGVAKRYDPSHVPFVFDKHIYRDFVRKFATLVEATISHKFRRETDFPPPFGYYNFVMSEWQKRSDKVMLREVTDRRTGKIHFSQLEPYQLGIEELIDVAEACLLPSASPSLAESRTSFHLSEIEGCDYAMSVFRAKLEPYSRYSYGTRSGYGDNYLEWVGVTSDAKEVTGHLKRWLRNKKKFAFMQDGTKRSQKNFDPTETLKVMEEYMQVMYPKKSKFEK